MAPGIGRDRAGELVGRFPLVGHSVGANLGGADPLDEGWLEAVAAFVRDHAVAWHSDHLCWSASAGHRHHDLLPLPHHPDLVGWVADRARQVQARIGVPFGLENVSSYLRWREDLLPDMAFFSRVVQESGCWALLDINNLYVSSKNHGFDPYDALEMVDFDRVLQVHLAGHSVHASGLLHDTHDAAVAEPVWDLYKRAWALGGPFPTLLEWDEQIPPLTTMLRELDRAAEVRR
jgi:uncharacterized protein (UPF0276 family)